MYGFHSMGVYGMNCIKNWHMRRLTAVIMTTVILLRLWYVVYKLLSIYMNK
jgi:hypothetical protein